MSVFKSGLSNILQEFLDYEKAAGRCESSYLPRLRNLDSFCLTNYPDETELSEDIVLEWAVRRKNESDVSFNMRCSFIRKLGRYLVSVGKNAYILSNKLCSSVSTFNPYIFSDDEIHGLFHCFDSMTDKDPFVPFIVSTAFRLVHTCGLRPNEVRHLKHKNVNLQNGEILITETKGHRERIVVMSQDMLELARTYSFLLDTVYPDSEYFFPDPNGEAYSSEWFQKWLKKAFREVHSDIPEAELPAVRVYDLRHRFASAVLMRWIDNGTELYSRLPYLQAFMGHKRLASTAYYIHLLPENLVRSSGIDWDVLKTIIPEVDLWED